jgi:hypothetical protein
MPLPPPRAAIDVDLSGRVVMVTGASGGLGKPFSLACAARGATLVLHGRVVRKLEAIYDEIVAAGHPQPTILPLDLATASADDFDNVAGAIRAQLGRLDGLVHAAAFLGSLGPIEHQSFDVWQKVLRVNLAAAMALTRSTMPLLSVAPDASVIFTLDTRGEERLLGRLCRSEGRACSARRNLGRRMGKPFEPARQCGRSRANALATPCADASRRAKIRAAVARGAVAALPAPCWRASQIGEWRAD